MICRCYGALHLNGAMPPDYTIDNYLILSLLRRITGHITNITCFFKISEEAPPKFVCEAAVTIVYC